MNDLLTLLTCLLYILLYLTVFFGSIVLPIYLFIGPNIEKKKLIRMAKVQLEEELAHRDFVVSKSIEIPCYNGLKIFKLRHYMTFLVDDEHKKFAIFYFKKKQNPVFTEIKYSDMLDFNLFEDGIQQIEGRGMLSAAGAMMFGTAGAVVGSSMGNKSIDICNELSVQIQVNDLNNPLFTIVCAKNMTKRSKDYMESRQTANDIIATLTYIEHNK